MGVRIKTDENLPASAAEFLRKSGHDVFTVLEQGLGGVADPRVASVCQTERRAIMTLDRGLGDIRAYPPADYAGIIVLRPANQEIDTLLGLVRRVASLIETQPLATTLWIVDDRRVRIRR